MTYKFTINQCDVRPESRPALEAYRAKRLQWIGWLDEDPDHAIWTAISSMVWTDVSFRTLAQLALDDPQSPLGNTLLAEQLINGHVATQILAIRRLIDDRRDVISLRRLIKDVRTNFHLFTRENYVCFDGLPFDYEAAMTRDAAIHAGKGARWVSTAGPDAWGTSSMAHEQFDRLSGIDSKQRSPDDRLPRRLIDAVDGWLDASDADALAGWSHAYLAHAGSAANRERIADAVVTNNKITETIKALARATEAVSAYILFASGRLNSLMPTPQFDQFELLDKPVLDETKSNQAQKIWNDLSDERDGCLEGVRDDLIAALK